jgi:hypothetical protein
VTATSSRSRFVISLKSPDDLSGLSGTAIDGNPFCGHLRKQGKEFAMNKFILVSMLAAGFAMGLPAGARADSNVKDYFDRREIGDPYGCYGCYPRWRIHQGRLSCSAAKARVRNSGYRNVATIECRGSTYTFEATRKGRDVKVLVNSKTGAIWRR